MTNPLERSWVRNMIFVVVTGAAAMPDAVGSVLEKDITLLSILRACIMVLTSFVILSITAGVLCLISAVAASSLYQFQSEDELIKIEKHYFKLRYYIIFLAVFSAIVYYGTHQLLINIFHNAMNKI